MEFTIRSYQAGDLEACLGLWAILTEQHRILYGDPGIGGREPGLHFDRYLRRPDLAAVWVAEAEGQAVGLAGLLLYGEEAEIEPVVVEPAYQSQGLGRGLVASAVEEARRRGVRFLSVRPVARNRRAINFFFENGFRLAGQIELFQELSGIGEREWIEGLDLHGNRLGY